MPGACDMSSHPRLGRTTLGAAAAVCLLMSMGCADEPRSSVMPTAPSFGKVTSGPTVTAATPAFGRQGQTGEEVTITGSGFAPGAVAAWQENGVVTSRINVRQTQFVSSTQLVATIDVAPDADLAFYDIAVTNSDRKKGIGTELFEVTTALALTSLSSEALSGNANGEAVGNAGGHGFYWSEASGLVDIGAGAPTAIDEAGMTIAGSGPGAAAIWTRSGSAWTLTSLPKSPASVGGRGGTIASDPVTGVAAVIGGSEDFPSRNNVQQQPRLWKWIGGGWQKVDLVSPYPSTGGWVNGVTASGVAVGIVNGLAVIWEANGSYTVLAGGGLAAVNSAGTLAVGFTTRDAAYYKRNAVGDAWSGPFVLPGGCKKARGVDDAGHIVVMGCNAPLTSRLTSAVIAPPYTSLVYLGGLGDVSDGGTVWRVPPGGAYIYGYAPIKGTNTAVRWRSPF